MFLSIRIKILYNNSYRTLFSFHIAVIIIFYFSGAIIS